ncbi:MAG: penicillin-binding protein activator LpoB [Candidatus Eisenbacteria sp.]|nr:penicillin-binding protein activator LpoB [Candidatus Eisenbacteria bacterium]
MKRIMAVLSVVLVLVIGLSAGCAKKVVTRVDPTTVIDLSGYWNDTDSRLVAEEMIADCLSRPWRGRHVDKHGKRPVVIVGQIANKTTEHIATTTFISDIERAFINSADVEVVAGSEERGQVRDEREDQQVFSSPETAKQWGKEKGADYMMSGIISSITDEEDGKKVVFYQVDLTLIHLQDNTKVWLGQKKIKKFIGRGKYKG